MSETIYCELREAINSTSIFDQDKSYLAQFNLCCAVIDRLETCVINMENTQNQKKTS